MEEIFSTPQKPPKAGFDNVFSPNEIPEETVDESSLFDGNAALARTTPIPRCPVVGIGASAGGLHALEHLLRPIPGDVGYGYIVVTHLDPTHKSLMTQLLQRYTPMPVHEIEDGTVVEPNHVYMIPPNKTLSIEGDKLRTIEPVLPRGFRDPINTFLISLAEEYGPWAVAVILSGTGSDGMEGCSQIRNCGGYVAVQDPRDAQYDGMPASILNNGLQDGYGAAGDLVNLLVQRMATIRSRFPEFVPVKSAVPAPRTTEDDYVRLLAVLLEKTGQDLSHYKRPTILRRIERRLSATESSSLSEYVDLLSEDEDEPENLLMEVLINVTSFFRDAAAYESLRREVVQNLVRSNSRNQSGIRVWVAGCSTGEEAYSIAMMILEELDRVRSRTRLHVFATDVDAIALEVARNGFYSDSSVANLTPEQKERFFVKEGNGYRISRQLRNCVVFAQHDLVSDAPLSRIDLVSCRNVFIYFDAALQRRCLEYFNYSLVHGGYLFLGASESLSDDNELFRAKNSKTRIFLKETRRHIPNVQLARSRQAITPAFRQVALNKDTAVAPDIAALAQSCLLQHYAPGTAVVNEKHQVLYTLGPISDVLRLPEGVMENDIISMCPEEIRLEIRGLIRTALTNPNGTATYEGLKVQTKQGNPRFKVVARVIANISGEQKVIAITFEPLGIDIEVHPLEGSTPPPDPKLTDGVNEVSFPKVVGDLDQELRYTKAFLQSVVDELERSNYELKVTNEELTSMNEEMQATTEELETSKEELQSINEELQSVNSELQVKLEQLADANDDMANLLNGTQIATLFLDANLCIKRYTSALLPIFRLLPADIGRPISHISHSIGDEDLIESFGIVLKTMNTMEKELSTRAGQWYIMRVIPYRTQDNTISGVVVTFTDITELKNFQDALRRSEGRNNALLEAIPDTLVVTGRDGSILDFKPGRGNIQLFPDRPYGRQISSLLKGIRPSELVLEPEFIEKLQEQLNQVIDSGGEVHMDMRVGIPAGPTLWYDVHLVPCGKDTILCIFRNVSDRKELESRLNHALQRAEKASRAKSDFLANMSHELRTPLNAVIGFAEILQAHEEQLNTSEYRDYIGHIQQGGRVLLNLVNAILDLAKIESGHFELRYKTFRVQDVIRSTLKLSRPIFDKRGIDLAVDLPISPIDIFADEERFVQILLNLLSNAGKFTPENGQVRITAQLADDDKLTISVSDNGAGIPETERGKIFERFVQGGTSGKGAGTGLGLTLTKSFVELHGGRISLTAPGIGEKGCTFTFWIPLRSSAS